MLTWLKWEIVISWCAVAQCHSKTLYFNSYQIRTASYCGLFFPWTRYSWKVCQEKPAFLLEQSTNLLHVPSMLDMGAQLLHVKMLLWWKCCFGKQTRLIKMWFISWKKYYKAEWKRLGQHQKQDLFCLQKSQAKKQVKLSEHWEQQQHD